MANENETVEQVCDAVKGDWRVLATNEDGDAIRGFTEEDMESFAQSIIAAHKREIEAKNKKIQELLNLLPDCIKCAKYAHGCSCEDGFAAACDKFENKEIAIRDELIQAFCSHLRKWMDYTLPISGGMNDEWEEATMLIANARRVLK